MSTVLGIPVEMYRALMVGSGIAGGVLLLVALILPFVKWHRARARRIANICTGCGYDLASIESVVCPECHVARNASRRWRFPFKTAALGGLLVCLTVHLLWWAQRQSRGEGATKFIPTTALIFLVDVESRDNEDTLRRAVIDRQDRMWGWQEYIGTWRELRATPAPFMANLVESRELWPSGSQVLLEVRGRQLPDWIFLQGEVQISEENQMGRVFGAEIVPPMHHGGFVCHMGYGPRIARYLAVNGLTEGEHCFHLVAELKPRHGPSVTETTSCRVKVVPAGASALEPVKSLAIDDAVRLALRGHPAEMRRSNSNPGPLVQFDPFTFDEFMKEFDPDCRVRAEDLGFEIEIRDGEKVVSRGRSTWNPDLLSRGMVLSPWDSAYIDLLAPLKDRPYILALPPEVVDRLTVHIRGMESISASNARTRCYWSGEVTVPYRDLRMLSY